jgi:hypothetical protein
MKSRASETISGALGGFIQQSYSRTGFDSAPCSAEVDFRGSWRRKGGWVPMGLGPRQHHDALLKVDVLPPQRADLGQAHEREAASLAISRNGDRIVSLGRAALPRAGATARGSSSSGSGAVRDREPGRRRLADGGEGRPRPTHQPRPVIQRQQGRAFDLSIGTVVPRRRPAEGRPTWRLMLKPTPAPPLKSLESSKSGTRRI